MKTKGLIILAITSLLSLNGHGQDREKRFGIELNGGASFATSKLGGVNLNTGFGFETVFHYRFYNHLGVYTGWGWNKFSSSESFGETKSDFEETGYVFGLQFKHPIASSSISYYARVGGLYNHIEIEGGDDVTGDTGHGFGYQIAAGIDIPLSSSWSINPGLKFNAISREIESTGANTNLDLNYVMVRVGFVKNF